MNTIKTSVVSLDINGHSGCDVKHFSQCNVLITWPRSNGTCCFVQTRYRTLNKWFMAVLLTHRYHSVLACRYSLLPNCPVAWHVTRIHAGIIWTLQSTFVAITFFKLTRTISSRWNAPEIKGIGCCAVADDRLTLTQELVANPKLEGYFLLNWWSVKHLVFKRVGGKWDEIIGYCLNVR